MLKFPLSILAWLEAAGLRSELAPFIKRSRASDRWFLCLGGETYGPVSFDKVQRMLLRGEGPVSVLHESDVEADPAPWHALNYHAWPVNRGAAIAWVAGFWLLAVAVGFVAVTLASPVAARAVVGAAYLVAILGAVVWLGLGARRAAATVPDEAESPDAEPSPEGETEYVASPPISEKSDVQCPK